MSAPPRVPAPADRTGLRMTLQTAIASSAPTDTAAPEGAPEGLLPPTSEANGLLVRALEPFRPMAETFDELARAIDTLAEIGGRPVAGSTRRLKRTLRRTEPSVTMIGQVKAG